MSVHVASLVDLGELDQPRAAAVHLLDIAPGFGILSFVREGFARPELMNKIAVALRKAGLPD